MFLCKGCLSGINPHYGTNKNEALHRYLNPYFKQPEIGVDLAYALIITLVVLFNSQRAEEEEPKTVQQTIAAAAKADYVSKLHSTSTAILQWYSELQFHCVLRMTA